MRRGWSVLEALHWLIKTGFEYHLVVSYEIILYQHCKFSTNYHSAVIDKYGKEAAVGGAIQLYKIFKDAHSSIIPTLILTVALPFTYLWL